jgi:diaminopimelate decarboxylase
MTNRRSANADAALPPHPALWPDTARVAADGRLTLGGLDAATLAHENGTPLYIYDEATIRAQCRAFREAFADRWAQSAVAYAAKAYLSPALARLVMEEGLELDAVSAGELGVAGAAGFPLDRVHLHGNFKPDAELEQAVEAGVGRVVVDSLDELAHLEAIAQARQRRVAIWLRLNPNVATHTHVYTQTGHADTKFGLSTDALLEAARRATASAWLDLAGLHAHAGSQLFDLAPVAAVVRILGELAATLRETEGVMIRELSPGGGLAVAYTPEEQEQTPGVEVYAQTVTRALADVVERLHLASPRLVVELGRAIVARAGVALYTVGPRKETPEAIFLAVDGGMGDNPRPALYGARYVAALPERMLESPVETACVVGRYCESGDVLVEGAALPRARTGEILAIPVSGAYHLPMASNYNLVPRPAVLFVRDGSARLVRRRETLDDLMRLDAATA